MPVVRELSTESASVEEIARLLRPPLLERYAEQAAEVRRIVADVAARGDQALVEHTRRLHWPGADATMLEVTSEERERSEARVPESQRAALMRACEAVRRFHQRSVPKSWLVHSGDRALGQRHTPLERVGIYVPGGVPLPSTVYMCAVPARVAGVSEIVMVTPADRDGQLSPLMLYAARVAGVDRVFRVGGAQAIAALAYGTAAIPRVDKIVGPGSVYVTLAKREVFGVVGIESLPGPSDVLVISDGSVPAAWVAADLLSQAEHVGEASAVLCTTQAAHLALVRQELEQQLRRLPDPGEAAATLLNRGALVLCRSLDECVAVANAVAPEHLEVLVERDAEEIAEAVRNAGAIFIGPYTPEPVGDYVAGPSHVLPTEGTARFASPLGVEDFMKRTSIVRYSRAALCADAADVVALAEAEGLVAHARAVSVRFENQ